LPAHRWSGRRRDHVHQLTPVVRSADFTNRQSSTIQLQGSQSLE
jgi:hypothetical protein